jgi:hypothetical protein
MYAHLTNKTLTSTYIFYACIRVVNVYLCVHAHVHTRIHILLIHNTHLPIACIRVLYVYVCARVCIQTWAQFKAE